MVFCEDYQGDLKASLAGGVCIYPKCFLYINYCIRLCHRNKIDLLTYLLTHSYTLLKNTTIEHSERLVTLETCDKSDEET